MGCHSELPIQGVQVRSLVRELRSHMSLSQKIQIKKLMKTKINGQNCKSWRFFFSLLEEPLSPYVYLVTQSCLTLCDPWTVACQAPLTREFFRQEYWSGLPCLSPGDLPNPGITSRSPALQADSLLSEPPGKPPDCHTKDKLKSIKRGEASVEIVTHLSGGPSRTYPPV